ncbi:uncharacterized protein [Prorops nasuta]|uniref:uncharacterized protein n=1 Tax=Prorops nasuta TaxID=863751 RepID=UPI0034CEFB5B
MTRLALISLLLLPLLHSIQADDDHEHHHVIIHVPYKVKTIKHTHTIVKHIHHGKDDKYEVLGYTVGKPIDLGGHEGGGDLGGHVFLSKGHSFGGGDIGGHSLGGGGHSFEGGENSVSYGGHDFGGHGGFSGGEIDGGVGHEEVGLSSGHAEIGHGGISSGHGGGHAVISGGIGGGHSEISSGISEGHAVVSGGYSIGGHGEGISGISGHSEGQSSGFSASQGPYGGHGGGISRSYRYGLVGYDLPSSGYDVREEINER